MSTFDAFIDPTTGDLPEVSAFVTGPDFTTQRARVRLGTHGRSRLGNGTIDGEWLLDRFVGLPFAEWREAKPPDLDAITAVVLAELSTTPGVVRVEQINATFDPATRTVRVFGDALIEGIDEVDQVSAAFVVALGGNTTPVITMFYASGAIV
jgi:hypothetical protein